MPEVLPERRRHARSTLNGDLEVMVDEIGYPAEISDLSPLGVQVRIDPVIFDEIRERIDAVRFGDHPPLAVQLRWGFFDGNFGASFRDEVAARPIVEQVLNAVGASDAVPAS